MLKNYKVIEGRIEGKRGKGKPRIIILDDIIAHYDDYDDDCISVLI